MAKSIVHKVSLNKKTLCGRKTSEAECTNRNDWVTCKVCKRALRGAWSRAKF